MSNEKFYSPHTVKEWLNRNDNSVPEKVYEILSEALNVKEETGMTPSDLQKRIKELEELVPKAFSVFRFQGFPHNTPTLGDWLKENDIQLYEKLNNHTP